MALVVPPQACKRCQLTAIENTDELAEHGQLVMIHEKDAGNSLRQAPK